MNPITAIKFIGCWSCIVGALVLLVIGSFPVAMVAALGILAIAFAMAPASW